MQHVTLSNSKRSLWKSKLFLSMKGALSKRNGQRVSHELYFFVFLNCSLQFFIYRFWKKLLSKIAQSFTHTNNREKVSNRGCDWPSNSVVSSAVILVEFLFDMWQNRCQYCITTFNNDGRRSDRQMTLTMVTVVPVFVMVFLWDFYFCILSDCHSPPSGLMYSMSVFCRLMWRLIHRQDKSPNTARKGPTDRAGKVRLKPQFSNF